MARLNRVGLAACVAVSLVASQTPAQTSTWNGLNTGPYDWNLPGNWNPLGVPGATTIPVLFTDTSPGTVNVSSTSDMAQSLTFTNTNTSYTITSSAGIPLNLANAITVNSNLTGIDSINVANIATGSLLFASGNTLTITNNSAAGGVLLVGPNTVIGTSGNGGVIFGGLGNVFFSGAFANSSGSNYVEGNVTKAGPGLLDYSGSGTNLFQTSNLVLNGGVLQLDYTGTTPTSKMTASGTTAELILEGGLLSMLSNPTTSFTQTVPGGTVVSAGHTDVKGNGTGTITLNAGAITHSVGGTVDFAPSSASPTFSIQTSTTNTNGLLGSGPAFATVAGGTGWATQSGVVVAPLAGYSVNIFGSTDNTDVTANDSPATFTTNSLRFNSGSVLTLTLTGTNTLQSGGVLATPNAFGGTITGGTLEAPSSGELFFHIYNTGFEVDSNLVSTAGLTKTGPGILNLTGNNSGLTGPINVNRGGLYVTSPAALGSAGANNLINFNDDRSANVYGGLQSFTLAFGNNSNGTVAQPIRLSAGSVTDYGTYFSTGNSLNSIITLSGVISTANPGIPINTPIRFTGDSSNTSGFYLTNTANTFTGNVSLYQGYLGIAADGSLGAATNVLNLEVGSAASGGLVFLNNGTTVGHAVSVNLATRIVVTGTNSDAISGAISGIGGIYKDGSGTLTISNANNSVTGGVNVLAGTLSLGATGVVPTLTNLTVAAGATFSPGTVNGIIFNAVNLNGGTFRVSAGSGNSTGVVQIMTNAAGGTLDFTGAGADQILFPLAGAGITIDGNSTWLNPANGSKIVNGIGADIPISISPGVTLTNGFPLSTNGVNGFRITGGGILFQNSDTTNLSNMTVPLTVSQGSEFRVTDASSNGGVGNLGTGLFTLDGGTFSYGGATATTTKAISLTSNGGTIQVESAATTLTANGAITSITGGLTKIGQGTLVLGSTLNSFASLAITAGTVQTATDITLGTGPIAIGPFGTLAYTGTTTTSRTISMNSGTLSVAAGQTLTLNNAAIGGGFLGGAGTFATSAAGALFVGVTSLPSVAIVSNSAADQFVNFTNSAALSVAAGVNTAGALTTTNLNGFTNQGLGSIAIGAGSQLNVANFQSYGNLSLAPATASGQFTELANTGTAPLGFNGGSQSFIGSISAPNANVVGVDLHGQNLVITGGLFVNNGLLFNSLNNGNSTIYVEYGATYKGAGTTNVPVITQNGGKVVFGNCPGVATFGSLVVGAGGINDLEWEINDAGPSASYPNAPGVPGPTANAANRVSGWSLGRVTGQALRSGAPTYGNLSWTATPTSRFDLELETLVGPATQVGATPDGLMADFDPRQSYSWPIITYQGAYSGPSSDAQLTADTLFDSALFANAIPAGSSFGLHLDQYATGGGELDLIYTPSPVPEPGTLALLLVALPSVIHRGLIRRLIYPPG